MGFLRKLDRALLRVANPLSLRLSRYFIKGLWFKSPRASALSLIKLSLALGIASASISLPLSSILNTPLPMLLLTTPFIALAIGLYLPIASARSRRAGVEAELPIFSVLASVMAVSGLSLIRSFELALQSRLFPAMSREAALLRRNALYFNRSPLEALEEVAKNHPSESFRQWIFGYTSVLRSGGDVAAYLTSKARVFLRTLERKWMSYANATNVLGEAVLALFLICPLTISLMSLIFAGGLSLLVNNVYSFVVVPSVAVLSVLFIHHTQPKTFDVYELKTPLLLSLLLGAITLMLTLALFNLELHVSLLASLLAFSAPIGLSSYRQLKAAVLAEKALPEFLRDITEQVKLGFDVVESIKRRSYRGYNSYFDNILAFARNHLSLGGSLEEVAELLRTPSWIVRSTFLILAQVAKTGTARPIVLEMLTDYISDYYSAKLSGRSSVKLQVYVGYGAPAFMVVGALMLKALAQQLSPIASPQPFAGSWVLSIAPSYHLFLQALSSVMVMIVVSSFIIGVIIAKVYDLTLLSFKHSLVCLVVAAISMRLGPLLITS